MPEEFKYRFDGEKCQESEVNIWKGHDCFYFLFILRLFLSTMITIHRFKFKSAKLNKALFNFVAKLSRKSKSFSLIKFKSNPRKFLWLFALKIQTKANKKVQISDYCFHFSTNHFPSHVSQLSRIHKLKRFESKRNKSFEAWHLQTSFWREKW